MVDLLPDLDRGFSKLLDSLRQYLAAWHAQYSISVHLDLDQGNERASQCLRHLGTTYTPCKMRPGSALHQKETRAHCTNIRSDSHSEDTLPYPQGIVGYDMVPHPPPPFSEDMPLQIITDPPPNWSCDRQHNVHHGISWFMPVTCASGRPVSSGVLWQMPIELFGAGLSPIIWHGTLVSPL